MWVVGGFCGYGGSVWVMGEWAVGDREYDHDEHHGSPENRMLAVSSGLIYGASKGKNKDAYYKMFCLNSEG